MNVTSSTALLTDRYELTMLDAALQAGTAAEPATFEVFTRGLPAGRQMGVFAGLGRLLDAIEAFRFGPEELAWLGEPGVVTPAALEWLAAFEFAGDVDAYAEGELYTGGSPVLTVEAPFGQAVLLETLVLSILNHDSAVAAAASLIARAAAGRPVIEMGSRRTDAWAAVAAARAAYIGGLDSTSNLEAGRRYGVPTAGTVAHAFVLSFADEGAAFAAQVKAFGPDSTFLVDTYDMEDGIRRAVEAAGPELTAIRVDSGDLGVMARRARELLDELGASRTRVIVTGDLDDRAIRALGAAPVDGYGAGTSVVTGLGAPTAGLIYKLVAVGGRPVAKRSPGKATFGGRKWAWRVAGRAEEVVATSPEAGPDGGRPLQSRVMTAGARVEGPGTVSLDAARAWHQRVRDELPAGEALQLVRAR
ncbi:MAG TPA: nicotinate phosphoribosyltransferase [Acidimicrobiales bacterium]